MYTNTGIKPTTGSERLQVLDALRGFALFGILLANLYSFMGYNTYSPEEIVLLPIFDRAVLFFIDWFVEGKFYGIFSILFGVGFALQAERFRAADVNFSTFWFRRMIVLCCIGLLHMYLVWNGDILTLYSILGMLLPMFLTLSNRTLVRWILVLCVDPVTNPWYVVPNTRSFVLGSYASLLDKLENTMGICGPVTPGDANFRLCD